MSSEERHEMQDGFNQPSTRARIQAVRDAGMPESLIQVVDASLRTIPSPNSSPASQNTSSEKK